MFNKSGLPLLIIFLISSSLILGFRKNLEKYGFDWQVLSAGNIFIYVITMISMYLLTKGMNASNTQAFLRHTYSSILMKLFACAGAAFIYIFIAGNNLNKPALFTCMAFYLVYTFVEMSAILKQSNRKKNVEN